MSAAYGGERKFNLAAQAAKESFEAFYTTP